MVFRPEPWAESPMTDKTRFYGLDGVRGLAAVSIMLFHYTQYNGLSWFKAAPMAVDLFFILSGFVIRHGYGDRIANGLPFHDFLRHRTLRLWPVYMVGLMVGVVAAALQGMRPVDLSIVAAMGSALLPNFYQTTWALGNGGTVSGIFPLNGTTWSLFFEVVVNMVFFAWIALRRRTALTGVAVVSGLVYAVCVLLSGQVNPGWGVDNFWLAFPRVIAEFSLGVCLYNERDRLPRLPDWLLPALGAIMLFLFLFADGRALLLYIFVLAPLLILSAARLQPRRLARKLCQTLGDMSYPLYVLHIPLYALMGVILPLDHMPLVIRTTGMAVLAIGLSIGLAHLDRYVRLKVKGAHPAIPAESLP